MNSILEIRELTKHFRHNWTMRRMVALEGLDLSVRSGEILGLIGPNGAGKTTTFKVVLGLLHANGGTVLFRGQPLSAAARAAIGFLPEQPYFYDYLTVEEMLTMYGQLYGLHGSTLRQRVGAIIEQVQLGHKRGAALRSLSKAHCSASASPRPAQRSAAAHPRRADAGLDPIGRRHARIDSRPPRLGDGDLLLARPSDAEVRRSREF
jgi:ABC-2 type transport system ATP-binding protein